MYKEDVEEMDGLREEVERLREDKEEMGKEYDGKVREMGELLEAK